MKNIKMIYCAFIVKHERKTLFFVIQGWCVMTKVIICMRMNEIVFFRDDS